MISEEKALEMCRFHIYGTPIISDPTKIVFLRPIVPKSLKWYNRLWQKIFSWIVWFRVKKTKKEIG